MSEQEKRFPWGLIGAILAAALVGFAVFAWIRADQPEGGETVGHKQNPVDAVKHWTTDKMKAAQAFPMPHVGGTDKMAPKPEAEKSDEKKEK